MTTASWTNQTQWTSAARAANHEHFVTVNNLPTGETITFLIERMPFTITIESLQHLELFAAGEFDGSEQWHRNGELQ